jgi:predicted  nucleic acid-binding Zn-ribbon protein
MSQIEALRMELDDTRRMLRDALNANQGLEAEIKELNKRIRRARSALSPATGGCEVPL